MLWFLFIVFLCLTAKGLVLQFSDRNLLDPQRSFGTQTDLKGFLRFLANQEQFSVLAKLLKFKSVDLKGIYDGRCLDMNFFSIHLMMRDHGLGKLTDEDMEVLLSADCLAQIAGRLANQMSLYTLLSLNINILESEYLRSLPAPDKMIFFINKAWLGDERCHLVNWSIWTQKFFGHDICKYLDAMAASSIKSLWQTIGVNNFATIDKKNVVVREHLINFIGMNKIENTEIVGKRGAAELIMRYVTLKAFRALLKEEDKVTSRLTPSPTSTNNYNHLFALLQTTQNRLVTLLGSNHEAMLISIENIAADPSGVVYELFQMVKESVLLGDWYENLLVLVNTRSISSTVLMPILHDCFSKRPSAAAVGRIFEQINDELPEENAHAIMRTMLQDYQQYLPVLYTKHRRRIPDSIVTKMVGFEDRILHNLREYRQSDSEVRVIYFGFSEGLRGLINMMLTLPWTTAISLNQQILIKTVNDVEEEYDNYPLSKFIERYFRFLLQQPKLYHLHGRTSDDRPIISLSAIFPPRFWYQFGALLGRAFLLKIKVPFVFESSFFASISKNCDAKIPFLEKEDQTLGRLYNQIMSSTNISTRNGMANFLRIWSQIVDQIGGEGPIRCPLSIRIPEEADFDKPEEDDSETDNIWTILMQGRMLMRDGLSQSINLHDFTLKELYQVLFRYQIND